MVIMIHFEAKNRLCKFPKIAKFAQPSHLRSPFKCPFSVVKICKSLVNGR